MFDIVQGVRGAAAVAMLAGLCGCVGRPVAYPPPPVYAAPPVGYAAPPAEAPQPSGYAAPQGGYAAPPAEAPQQTQGYAPAGQPVAAAPVVYSATCSAGIYTCTLLRSLPVGTPCSCPGLGAPSFGRVR